MATHSSFRTYWSIWGVLLVLTLAMIALESLQFSPVATVLLLSIAMMVKATLIAGWFMHLRWERLALTVIVAATILVTAAFMFFLLIPDALAVLETGPHT